MIDEALAKKQGVTEKQRKKLRKLYVRLADILDATAPALDEHKPAVAEKLRKLEFKLQKNWNFPQDANFHTYQFRLPGCICPKIDNAERFGMAKITTVGCPYHSPKVPYKGITITDKNTPTIKSDVTTSIDVHLREDNQYVNIILPSNHIIVIESDGEVNVYDHTDTYLGSHRLVSK